MSGARRKGEGEAESLGARAGGGENSRKEKLPKGTALELRTEAASGKFPRTLLFIQTLAFGMAPQEAQMGLVMGTQPPYAFIVGSAAEKKSDSCL